MVPNEIKELCDNTLDFAQGQVKKLITNHPDYFPLYTEGGKWKHDKQAWTNWCEGFLAGMIWVFAERSGEAWWKQQAIHYSNLLEDRQFDREVHDLGFVFWSSWRRWLALTDDAAEKERINKVIIQAGKTMGLRFNEKGRYLRSFVAPESCFIDIMMNVGIIFYAAQQSGDEALLNLVTEHCLTTRRYLVRGDGSTAHEGLFNLETGEFIRQSTHQGWRDDSSWARGQAWALYGFGTVYSYTKDKRFLDTAQRCADFYIDRTPSHGVPPNDWEEEGGCEFESSAAAISAGGFLQLSQLTPDPERSKKYHNYALTIVQTLCERGFVASDTPGWEGILMHGSYHETLNLGVQQSVMWGEYFFVDILDQLSKGGRFIG